MKLDGAWKSRVVRPRELSAREIELWTAFCDRDPALAHPFFAFAFARAVDRVRPHVFVAVLERQGRTAGFLPFQFSGWTTRILGAAERVGGSAADRFGVIAGEKLDLSSAQLLRLAGLNSLNFSFLPAEQLQHGFAGQRAVTGQHVRLAGDPQSFWSTLKTESRKFAANVERNERLLEKAFGPLRMTLHADPGAELQRLIDEKSAQYLRTVGTNPLATRWRPDLFRELLNSPDPSCTAALSTLFAGDTWLASHLGVMSPAVFHYWYPVYNSEHAKFSPGHVLTKFLVLSALSAGMRFFDLGGYGQYKDHFRPEHYEYHSGLWHGDSLRGIVNRTMTSLGWRLGRIGRKRSQPEAVS